MEIETETIDKKFGEVIVKTCSFCGRTYNIERFYAIPNDDSYYGLIKSTLYDTIGKKQKKEVNDGICLKCILNGLLKICKNDKKEIDTLISDILKDKIIDNLNDKK